jgi:hypothetical protein
MLNIINRDLAFLVGRPDEETLAKHRTIMRWTKCCCYDKFIRPTMCYITHVITPYLSH